MSRRASKPTPLPRSRLDEVLRVGVMPGVPWFARNVWDRVNLKKQELAEKMAPHKRLTEDFVRVAWFTTWAWWHKQFAAEENLDKILSEIYGEIVDLLKKKNAVRIPELKEAYHLARDLFFGDKTMPKTFQDEAKKPPPYPRIDDGSIAKVFWTQLKQMAGTRAWP